MHGVLLLDKAPGKSSAEAIVPVKRAAGRRVRVGHAGTLDPFATGLLVVLIGDATRVGEYALRLGKTYDAEVRFGVETNTLDPTGEVVAESDPGAEAPDGLADTLSRFLGEIAQVPPAHSALKVGGKRAYVLARAGRPVEVPPRTVRIDAIETLSVRWPTLAIRVTCGAGTYIRSLARDLGRALGTHAHLAALRRAAIGPFDVARAVRAADAAERSRLAGLLLPPATVTRAAGVQEVALSPPESLCFVNGRAVPGARDIADGTRVAVHDLATDRLLGLADYRTDGGLRAAKGLSSAQTALLS